MLQRSEPIICWARYSKNKGTKPGRPANTRLHCNWRGTSPLRSTHLAVYLTDVSRTMIKFFERHILPSNFPSQCPTSFRRTTIRSSKFIMANHPTHARCQVPLQGDKMKFRLAPWSQSKSLLRFRTFVFLALLTGPSLGLAESLPLERAIRLALTHSTGSIIAHADVQRAFASFREARNSYVPQ